jgi:hypothetical protein
MRIGAAGAFIKISSLPDTAFGANVLRSRKVQAK